MLNNNNFRIFMEVYNQEIIKRLQLNAAEFITKYKLTIEEVVIEPKEIEIYYYKEGEFEDNSVHKNKLQEMNPNHFYIHRTGVMASDKYKGSRYAGIDLVLSNERGVYYSYLIRSAVINNIFVIGPNNVLNAIINESGLVEKDIERIVVKKSPNESLHEVLFSNRINLGTTVSEVFLRSKLRAVLCDELYIERKYPAKEKMIVEYLYDKIYQQDMGHEEAMIFAKEKLGYIPSSVRSLMIKETETNVVYLSDKLEIKYSDFFKRFTQLLNDMDIKWNLIPNTNDIWVRDFMPIQIGANDFLQYRYEPDYLQNKEYINSRSNPSLICESMHLKTKKVDIILDGGNVILCSKYIVMTDKVFTENGKEKNDPEFIKVLEAIFGREIIIIPWHCINPDEEHADVFGHSDGFIHWCGGNKVLMSNHRDVDSKEAGEIRRIMESYGFEVIEMLFDVENPEPDWNWAYINYLQVGQKIIMPSFGIAEDKQALSYVQKNNPDCEVRQIRMRDIAANGGALHCITWNIFLDTI